MLLALGSTTFDVADRALVVAVLAPDEPGALGPTASRAAADGADVIELPWPEVGPDVGVPVAVRTAAAAEARAAFAAGAVLAVDPTGFADPGYLAAVVDAGASVVGAVSVGAEAAEVVPALRALAARAADAGVPPGRVVVEPVPPPGRRVPLPPAPGLRCVGVPVLASLLRPDAGAGPDPGAVAGLLSVAVVRGCGLLRVAPADVRSARRVADVIGAVRRGRS